MECDNTTPSVIHEDRCLDAWAEGNKSVRKFEQEACDPKMDVGMLIIYRTSDSYLCSEVIY